MAVLIVACEAVGGGRESRSNNNNNMEEKKIEKKKKKHGVCAPGPSITQENPHLLLSFFKRPSGHLLVPFSAGLNPALYLTTHLNSDALRC
jgi:hypothetical protein